MAKFSSNKAQFNQDSYDKAIITPRSSEKVYMNCSFGGDMSKLNPVVRMFIEYTDYLGEVHTEDSFWTCGKELDFPYGESKYEMICHNKIDESIGRFIDPKGEEEHEAEIHKAMEAVKAAGLI